MNPGTKSRAPHDPSRKTQASLRSAESFAAEARNLEARAACLMHVVPSGTSGTSRDLALEFVFDRSADPLTPAAPPSLRLFPLFLRGFLALVCSSVSSQVCIFVLLSAHAGG